jgi:threonine dehydratase
MILPTFNDVLVAYSRIKPFIHRTPVMTSQAINDICQTKLFFKCENFQKVGAFKFRGSTNAVLSLSDEKAAKGVATHSSGNHAQALALAARMRGIPAFIVMPSNSPQVKKDAVAGYGAEIIFCEPTLEARERTLIDVVARTGAEFIHPYNNCNVIAGQGTAALELIESVENLDYVIAPVGGGGLLSGTLLTIRAESPDTKVIAAEPSGADDAFRSINSGRIMPSLNPKTICDGLLTSLGDITFSIISQNISRIVTVDDEIIIRAMKLIWERMKIVIEPSSATVLAVVLKEQEMFSNKRVGLILSGGNIDLADFRWS